MKTKKKRASSLTVHCGKCKHDHVAKTGPCTKSGCGCHALADAAQSEHDELVKKFMKEKYGKKKT